METKEYRYISDPGHGWLEVPRSQIVGLGIEKDISRYSYQRGHVVYLEEDCDMPKFITAMESHGVTVKTIDVYQENTPIRNYPSYIYSG